MSELPRPPEELLAALPPAVRTYLEALEARLAELDARLRQDSSTSSRPPSSDPPGTQAQRRAPPPPPGADGSRRQQGGQSGHPGHHRALLSEERVDRVLVVRPLACRGCGIRLGEAADAGTPADERVQ